MGCATEREAEGTRRLAELRRSIDHARNVTRDVVRQYLALLRASARWRRRGRGRRHSLPASLVVSLTSYPPRFGTLAPTLRCLLSQTVAADRTILWIARSDESLLPQGVKDFERHGLEIRLTEDLRSYKKIIPALLAFPHAFVATADDDTYYRPSWLEELVQGWDGDPRLVVCHRAHRVTYFGDGRPRPYAEWDWELSERAESVAEIFPTGVGGILYPPGLFGPEALDVRAFRETCPRADDIWLYWMGRLAGARYKKVGSFRPHVSWPGSQRVALHRINVEEAANDAQFAAIIARYGLPAVPNSDSGRIGRTSSH